MITSIVLVKYGHKTITPAMKTACHQFFFLGTERNLYNLQILSIDRSRED
jgi:hypothetical protein